MTTFRDFQQKAIDVSMDFLRNFPADKHLCVEAPTGSGKSYIAAGVCDHIHSTFADKRTLMLVPSKELVRQNVGALHAVNPDLDVGICCAGLDSFDTDNTVLVGTIQTIAKRLDAIGPVDLILVDEAHLVAPKSADGYYTRLIETMEELYPKVRVLGLTATPYRVGQGLLTESEHATFTHIVPAKQIGADIRALQKRGLLCEFTTAAVTEHYDTTGIRKRMGDFVVKGLDEMVQKQSRTTRLAVDEIRILTQEREAGLVFAVNVAHAQEILDLLGGDGVIVTGTTPAGERDQIVEDFRAGKIKYLVNVGVFTTGFDATNVDFIALLRPTSSPGLWVQMCGRGLRPHPDKDNCLLIDYGGNVERLGPVEDVAPPRKPGKGTGDPVLKTCPECDALAYAGQRVCSECGYEWPREIKLQRAAELKMAEAARPTGYTLKVHKKQGKPPSVAVTFKSGVIPIATDYLCFWHGGFAADRAQQIFWRFVDPAMIPKRLTADEVIAVMKQRMRMPSEIVLKKSGTWVNVDRWMS